MKLRGAILGLSLVTALSVAHAEPAPELLPRAASVSVCTDQFLLSLVGPDQVAAVSWQATSLRSPVRHLATEHPVIRGAAEELLAVEADLVIFDPYGHPHTASRLEELGTQVVRLGPIAGFEDVENEVLSISSALGRTEQGANLVEQLRARRNRLQQWSDDLADRPRALYVIPGGGGAGSGTFIDEVLRLAGFENVQAELGMVGWGRVPLEQLVIRPPDVLVLSFFEDTNPSLLDGFGRHPLFRELLEASPVIRVPAAPWACAGPYLLDAAEYLAQERTRLFPETSVDVTTIEGDGS